MARFWIIGGYGEVGSAVARSLIKTSEAGDEVFIAGRNLSKSKALANDLGEPAKAVEINVAGPFVADLLGADDVVVNTVETISDEWLSGFAQTGVSFIDVSATESYLNRVRGSFDQHASKSLCITEVGVSPGLTNLIAEKLVQQNKDVDSIHTFIEMGMGKHHGYAATKWFFEALASPYPAILAGKNMVLFPSQQIISVGYNLPSPREHKAIGVGFSDQVSIAQRHKLNSSQTFVGVAPNWVNNILCHLLRSPFGHLLGRYPDKLAGMMSKFPPLGPVRTSIKSVAFNSERRVLASLEVLGPDQSELTAEIAAMAARAAGTQKQTGVMSLPDVLNLDQVKQKLSYLDWL